MKKSRSYSFYIILGLPVATTIILTNKLGLSGFFNIFAGFVMTLYCMYAYFKPNKKDGLSSIASSFFLSGAFVLLSTFFLSLPLWLIVLGFK